MEPKIRFKGFEGEWKETIWGNHIVSTHTGTNLLGEVSNKGIPLLKMGNIQRGFFDLDKMEYLAANQNPPVNCIANYGDFFYNTRNTLELVGKGATWMKKDGIYAFNSNIAICKLDGIDTFFFNYLYNTLRSIKQVQARAKGTTSVAAVYMRDLKSIELALPHITEQQAIASYFTTLDSQISASTSRLTSLKQMKAASLQAMFPQEGETVPKIRFKGFKREWNISRLGDFSTSFSGGTPTAGVAEFYGGEIPFIRSGEIHENRTELFLTEAGINNSSAKVVEKGTLLYALYGATSGEVGISKIKGAINQAILAIYPNKSVNKIFLSNYLQLKKQRIVGEFLQGGQGNLSGALVKSILVTYPSLEEQQAIASYFTSLDRQISLQSQRLEKLKQIKSACLDKMFI